MKGRVFFLILMMIICYSCRNSSEKKAEFVFPEEDSVPLSEAQKLSPEAIADISRNISSPVEIANLLQMLEVPFSQNYVASSIDANKQGTSFDKALKLGILGADLGYLNMYEKTGSSLDVLSSIRKIADDIRVGQFFDFESIKRLSQSRSNLDSLLFISIDSYTSIDNYLRENDRGQLSALMIIGCGLKANILQLRWLINIPMKFSATE